jgi:competence ComEA-like helix-hairpin-helix protein
MKRTLTIMGILVVLLTLASLTYGKDGRVNINTATVDELVWVPGITQEMAENLVQFRNMSGPLSSLEDLLMIRGFNEGKIRDLECSLKVYGVSDFDITEHTRDWCNIENRGSTK